MADRRDSRIALQFIILIGILSFFADFTYEGSRSIVGPYLATLQVFGYALQMASVPALALTGSWPAAAALITLERVGKKTVQTTGSSSLARWETSWGLWLGLRFA